MRNGMPGAEVLFDKKQQEPRSIPSEIPWNWLGLAAAIVSGAIITFGLLPRLEPFGADQFLATQLIAGHVRSLMANALTDVASSDQDSVKPWLDAKLDFAPAGVDLSSQGFPFIGGRLDYLDNRPVAAQHFINLSVWPAGSDAVRSTKAMMRQGYQLFHWVDSDFNYFAISDVNANDLQTFKQQFEGQHHTIDHGQSPCHGKALVRCKRFVPYFG